MPIKYTSNTSSSEYINEHEFAGRAASETVLLGIPGHVVGVREIRGSKPGGTIPLLCPNFAEETTKKCSGYVRVWATYEDPCYEDEHSNLL